MKRRPVVDKAVTPFSLGIYGIKSNRKMSSRFFALTQKADLRRTLNSSINDISGCHSMTITSATSVGDILYRDIA